MPYIEKLSALCNDYGCEIKTDEPLYPHTTFRIGGKCRALVAINSTEALLKISDYLISENIRYFVLGRGSNVIVSDEGFDGVILLLSKSFSEIRLLNDTDIYCTAGASLRDVCLVALENSLEGMEFAFGIPGTCGGALFMNAGAYGGEIKDIIASAHYLENGEIHEIKAEDMDLSYRHSVFAENTDRIITDMVFRLKKGDKSEIKARMDDFMERRRSKQPLEYPSAGSTFKRPEGSFASLLIDQCGLKGMSVGDAQVSEKHSGFVINKGNATCRDVLELCDKVRYIVLEKTGYTLELEPLVLK
ncbi:MAG: UDP-N-acetylmuramate dehydrogenase [Oscillospiraceae bacterium]|nr:UDP-N-acetylmuramate dehydrogenase [Oscillospiraceae bacterium]